LDENADQPRDVPPVAWTVLGLHIVSLVTALVPYIMVHAMRDGMSRRIRDWYAANTGWSLALVFVLLACELVLMYLQARRAMLAQQARGSEQKRQQDSSTADQQSDSNLT
jgi:uncharacterized membrane protein